MGETQKEQDEWTLSSKYLFTFNVWKSVKNNCVHRVLPLKMYKKPMN